MKRSAVLVFMVALMLAGTAGASVMKGDTEIDALGGFTSISGADSAADMDALFLMGRYGYFITNEIQVAAVGMYANISNGDDVDIFAVGAAGKYHFTTDKQWVPYVGGQVLWGSVDFGGSDGDGLIFGPIGGVRYEMTPTTDLFIEGWYQFFEGDLGDAMDDMFAVMAGFVHQFK
ncbi:MAG: hypothetical protein KBE04_08250 [Phycisphaerae bacterium]|nr:hypothetical protein [Phycisphaerae bacterium]